MTERNKKETKKKNTTKILLKKKKARRYTQGKRKPNDKQKTMKLEIIEKQKKKRKQ